MKTVRTGLTKKNIHTDKSRHRAKKYQQACLNMNCDKSVGERKKYQTNCNDYLTGPVDVWNFGFWTVFMCVFSLTNYLKNVNINPLWMELFFTKTNKKGPFLVDLRWRFLHISWDNFSYDRMQKIGAIKQFLLVFFLIF